MDVRQRLAGGSSLVDAEVEQCWHHPPDFFHQMNRVTHEVGRQLRDGLDVRLRHDQEAVENRRVQSFDQVGLTVLGDDLHLAVGRAKRAIRRNGHNSSYAQG